MFNIFNCDWEEEILNYLELDRSRLPGLVPVEYKFSGLSSSMINKLGLPGDVAWIAGSADGPLTYLGSAAYKSWGCQPYYWNKWCGENAV